MLDAFKRLISRQPARQEWRTVAQWARAHKLGFKRVHEGDGFVIDGGMDKKPWRLEWGPPQRLYIDGQELRLRMELGLSPDLQMMLLSQPLLETLERQTFERFTESTQTLIGGDTPEEMRWLAMFPKVSYKASKNLRMRFGLVGSTRPEAQSWVEGPLVEQMERASGGLLQGEPPFLLMVLRGKVYLRMQLLEPEVPLIAQAVEVFEVAVLQALRVASISAESGDAWPSTSSSTAWQTQFDADPEDPKDRSEH